jgi:iron complex transport system permease protein
VAADVELGTGARPIRAPRPLAPPVAAATPDLTASQGAAMRAEVGQTASDRGWSRRGKAMRTPAERRLRRRARTVTLLAAGVAVVAAALVLGFDNPAAPGTPGRLTVLKMRAVAVGVIVVVAVAQGVATVVFHTITSNRVLTPSIMGFDALYALMQTATIFFFGATVLAGGDPLGKAFAQSALMVAFAVGLYGWLLTRSGLAIRVTLLVGVVIGLGFRAASTLMQRLLTPSDFDLLSARLFGNIANAHGSYLPVGAAIVAVAVGGVWAWRHHLDVIALGRDTAISLGLRHRRELLTGLVLVAVLISVSTTLVGPMTFFGFLAATLTYQLTGVGRHALVLPAVVAVGTAVLLSAYFVLRHVFDAAGLVTVIIEFAGGLVFLVHLIRSGGR